MCDCLVALPAAAARGSTLFAKNSDRPPLEPQRLEWHPARSSVPATVRVTHIEVEAAPTIGVLGSRPDWMWGFEHGVNEAGVACGNETIYTTLDPRGFPPALTGMDLVRLALERATTATEAVEVMTALLERYGQGGSGHAATDRPYWSSFLVADPSAAWVLETSGVVWEAERVDTARAISNRTTIPSFDAAHRHPRQPVERLVDPRLAASTAVLSAVPVTTDAVRSHLRSHEGSDEGWTVCMHVAGVEQTTASLIAHLDGERSTVEVLAGSPCASLYVPLFVGRPVGRPVAWERFAALVPTADLRRKLDGLEERLRKEARDDDGWAAEAWQIVDVGLAELGV